MVLAQQSQDCHRPHAATVCAASRAEPPICFRSQKTRNAYAQLGFCVNPVEE